MVAFLTRGFGRFSVAIFEPSEHRLADVDATVVDNIGFYHALVVGFCNLRNSPSEEVVTHVTKVERFVGVGGRIFHHGEGTFCSGELKSVVCIGIDCCEEL